MLGIEKLAFAIFLVSTVIFMVWVAVLAIKK
jgi:hypothetical protein